MEYKQCILCLPMDESHITTPESFIKINCIWGQIMTTKVFGQYSYIQWIWVSLHNSLMKLGRLKAFSFLSYLSHWWLANASHRRQTHSKLNDPFSLVETGTERWWGPRGWLSLRHCETYQIKFSAASDACSHCTWSLPSDDGLWNNAAA